MIYLALIRIKENTLYEINLLKAKLKLRSQDKVLKHLFTFYEQNTTNTNETL